MSLYPPPAAGYNGISAGLFPFEVMNRVFMEYIQIFPLYNLMGNEPTRPIVKHPMGNSNGKGLQYRVPKLMALNYKNPIMNYDQRRGNAQQQSVLFDSVNMDWRTFSVFEKGWDVLRLGTPVDISKYASQQITQTFSRNLNWDIFNCMTNVAYPALTTGSAATGNVAGNYPSYDRVVIPVVAANSFVTRANYQANATFPTLLNNFQTSAATTPAGTGLSTGHLEALKQMAERGNAADIAPKTEAAIEPAFVRSKAGYAMNKYIYLCHPQTLASLFADPLFANSTFNRGTVIDAENQPQTLNGADYIGEYRGIAIYSCRDLFEYSIKSQDGAKQAAWNIFMGAGAVSLGWDSVPKVGVELDNLEQIMTTYSHEIRGQKMLQFASSYAQTVGAVAGSNPYVEQGIIHSFVSF